MTDVERDFPVCFTYLHYAGFFSFVFDLCLRKTLPVYTCVVFYVVYTNAKLFSYYIRLSFAFCDVPCRSQKEIRKVRIQLSSIR